jgi:glucokinase
MLATAVLKSSKIPAVGIDLGGTTIKAALVSPTFELLAHDEVATDLSSQAALLESIAQLVVKVRGATDIQGVGFGLPSQVNQLTGRVVDSTNVPIADVAFKEEMTRRLGVAVEIDNDANVAALAEALVGVAQGLSHVIMLTLGTGVGGGIIIDGRIYRGATGYGGELGHMVVDENGPPCQGHCPNHGCLEVLASSVGVMHAATAIIDTHPEGTLAKARQAGTLGVHHVIDRGLAGDPECVEALAVVGRHLGAGIASYINIFNPQAIVIGGGISSAGELILGPARDEAQRRALPAPLHEVTIAPAKLGNAAGVLGAAALILT